MGVRRERPSGAEDQRAGGARVQLGPCVTHAGEHTHTTPHSLTRVRTHTNTSRHLRSISPLPLGPPDFSTAAVDSSTCRCRRLPQSRLASPLCSPSRPPGPPLASWGGSQWVNAPASPSSSGAIPRCLLHSSEGGRQQDEAPGSRPGASGSVPRCPSHCAHRHLTVPTVTLGPAG